MLRLAFRPAALGAALLALGVTAGADAQTTDQGSTGKPSTTMPSPSTGTKIPRESSAALSSGDRTFLQEAAKGGMMEVQLGQMAQQKASSEDVRQFGARMAEDHAKANEELKKIASAKGATLPASVDRGGQEDLQKMEKLSGDDFDREYMKHMVGDHKKDVSEFAKEAKSGKDGDIKQFAAKTLPTLQEHMKLAQATYDLVKRTPKSSTGSKTPGTTSSSGTMPSTPSSPTSRTR